MSDVPASTPAAHSDDPSHFLPSDIAKPPWRPPMNPGQPTASLVQKVKALSRIVNRMDEIKVSGAVEGPLLNRMISALLEEAGADGDPSTRQKFWACAMDAVLRIHELHAKVAADCLDLETKRSDVRMKRQMWKDKMGIKPIQNTTADVLSRLAGQAR